jgi:nucleoside-diphosphate-sugar epimerase
MRVLVTGSRGRVGSSVCPVLARAGFDVRPFDILDGNDVLNAEQLRSALIGCDAVVHAAALFEPPADDPDRLHAVNVEGTRRVLELAQSSSVSHVVFVSSAAATGVFKGERAPDYLPLDDDHPSYPASPYSTSKRRAELLCEASATASRMSVTVLRPPGVWLPETYARIQAARARDPRYEWSPFWEYGAFVDVRDLSAACLAALTAGLSGHQRMFVASSDITTSGRASVELAGELLPGVPWRGDDSYRTDPYQTLVRIDRARRLLGWQPQFTWRRFLQRDA